MRKVFTCLGLTLIVGCAGPTLSSGPGSPEPGKPDRKPSSSQVFTGLGLCADGSVPTPSGCAAARGFSTVRYALVEETVAERKTIVVFTPEGDELCRIELAAIDDRVLIDSCGTTTLAP